MSIPRAASSNRQPSFYLLAPSISHRADPPPPMPKPPLVAEPAADAPDPRS